MKEHMERKQSISLKWIKGESGAAYVCSAEVLDNLSDPTEDDLRRHCVDESENPQNP